MKLTMLLACILMLAATALLAENSLQRLIERAKAGSVVKVPAAVHKGPITVTKPLTLRGEDGGKSIIEWLGDEPALTIRGTKRVKLENLTVRWSQATTDAQLEAPAAIYVRDSTVLIQGCHLAPIDRPKQTAYGLLAAGRTNVTFTKGQTTGFAYTLMFTDGANGEVTQSLLTEAGHSVITLHAQSRVKITHNILARCGYHAVRNTGGTMEMVSNLVAENTRAGAYLGNKSAHGVIRNNLFTGSNGEIWAYSRSDVTIENNLFLASEGAGIGFRDTCALRIRRNSFMDNKQGVVQYGKDEKKNLGRVRMEGNHYWNNGEDFSNVPEEKSALRVDPQLSDSDNGDYSFKRGSPMLDRRSRPRAGLADPKPIRELWKIWKRYQSDGRTRRL